MNRGALLALISVAVLGTGRPAAAYYDDVHYALTYYIARQTGYTPQQSFRIASACSSVDWDSDTEPVQAHGQVSLLAARGQGLIDLTEFGIRKVINLAGKSVLGISTPWLDNFLLGEVSLRDLRNAATNARFRFHAFRNELVYDDCIGNAPDGAVAQGDIQRQFDKLFNDAIKHQNIGVYMHAFQDEEPHKGYGTTWGHNPLSPDFFNQHLTRGLPIGSTTDWVSHRRFSVENLCRTVNEKLSAYMRAISPHQQWRPYNVSEYGSLVNLLAAGESKKAPQPITKDIQRQLFIRAYARSKGVNIDQVTGSLVNHEELAKVASELGVGLTPEDMRKHIEGPPIADAIAVVNRALERAGFADRLPMHHYPYDIDANGYPDPNDLDNWVLVGSLTLKMRGSLKPVSVILKHKIRDGQGRVKETEMPGIKLASLKPGVPYTWTKLPIGEVIVEIKRTNGTLQKQTYRLIRRENSEEVFVPNTEAPPPSTPKKPTKPSVPAKPQGTEERGDFTGTWFSSVGRFGYPHNPLVFSQSGDRVNGTYKHAVGEGTITGTIKGRVLTFTLTDSGSADGKPYSVTGKGTFTIDRENKTFSGSYSVDGGIQNNGWRGHKLNP